MKYYRIKEFAKLIGKTPQTLRIWDEKGIFKPDHISEGGHRYYSEKQLNDFLKIKHNINKTKKTIGYCRVSSRKQKNDLERQIEYVKQYLIAQGKPFEIITDIGSVINYNKKGLNELLDKIINEEIDKIVVLYKDRLLRFGFELIENIANKFGVTIEIIDNTEKTDEEELTEDLIQIITVFSSKLNGKRAHKAKKIIHQLKEEDNNDKNI
ncbi:Predicted site-specific integrase-resolvase [Marinitoga hydrogenitolerans DSM 16785]|uniref:Predicted site-specific integrase-resolvase n=1 Tax=Marinitoga hydrogenitolerans (strain DSM 16785 / JCM 12826 / AT1271) TaxID=1122195 RepID=A0A1M4YST5_MARH1|nr:IS607 family transposase [Marinitoga hydrogenitolerans]SHF08844.1 Predicted site-specific integrase-resolvase [Marinitoga hydrogenitolerans DSM 16785]